MKKKHILLAVSLLFCSTILAQSSLKENLATLKSKIGEVRVDKTVFNQSLDIVSEETGKLVVAVSETDEKGKNSKDGYEFYLSDIDKNTVTRKPSGKKMIISFSTANGLKLIKHMKDDKLDGYASSFEIMAANSDDAVNLINLVLACIPLVKQNDKNWHTPVDALRWMKESLVDATVSSESVGQTFDFDPQKSYLASYTYRKADSKGAIIEEKYDFNLLDINKNDIRLKVNGSNLAVTVSAKDGERFFKYTKNGIFQNYQSNFEFSAADIEQARNMINALMIATAKSRAQFPEFSNRKQALDFIAANTVKVTADSKSVDQKFEFSDAKGIKSLFHSIEADSRGKNIDSLYEFYFDDVEENSIGCKVSGKQIYISFVIKNKQKFIRYSKDGIVQSYEQSLEMLSDNLETARCVIEAMKYAAKNAKTAPESFAAVSNALKFLKSNLGDIQTPSEQFTQTFSAGAAEPFNCKYSLTQKDAKGATTDESYEFYPYMMDPGSVAIKSAGKYLTVNIQSKDKKSFVKRYRNNEQQSYDSNVEFMTIDAKQAKDIAEALKYAAAEGKPDAKTYKSKQSAVDFIMGRVGSFKGGGREVKQKLEMTNNDPCKLSLNISTMDDKGKNTEEIYEFNMSDISKLAIDYKVTGKNVSAVLIAKNKLIKAYKNGVQQSFASNVEIIEGDVNTAREMTEAFKALASLCEQ